MIALTHNKATDKSSLMRRVEPSTVRRHIHRNLVRYLHLAQIGLCLIALCLLGGLGRYRYSSQRPSRSDPRRRLPSKPCPNCICKDSYKPRRECGDTHLLNFGKCEVRPCSDCKQKKRESDERREAEQRERDLAERAEKGWHITSAHSDKALTTNGDGASVTQEDIRDATHNEYQLWSLKWTEDGYYEIYNKSADLYLCADESRPKLLSWWSRVVALKENDGSVKKHQMQWIMRKVFFAKNGDIKYDNCSGRISGRQKEGQPDGHYIIQNRSSDFVLDIKGGSYKRGTNLITFACKGGNNFLDGKCRNQVFQFKLI